jgi:chromosome partitioning protein
VNLTALLASMGKRVLVIDLDPQGNTSSGLGVEAGDKCVYEALMGRAPMSEVIRKTAVENLSIAPADIRLAGAELELVDVEQREFRLKTELAAVQKDYDFIFIDCPPSLSLLTLNAMTAADSVLIPIQCEYYALEGVGQLMNTLQLVRKRLNPELAIEGVVLTMLDGRTNLGLQVVQEVKKYFKGRVYGSIIPRNVRLSEAPSHGKPIHVYDGRSTGANAYRELAAEFIEWNEDDEE